MKKKIGYGIADFKAIQIEDFILLIRQNSFRRWKTPAAI